jgi:hypothetical protein
MNMRRIASLLCLSVLAVGGAARAQYQPPPPPAAVEEREVEPAEEPAFVPRREAQGPAESAGERAVRYSRFSAGQGGPLFVFTQVASGLVTGGLLGNSLGVENGAYVGAVLGGLTLGTASALYQYYVPVGFMESLLAAGGATTGFIAGFGLATEQGWSSRDRALLTLLTTQAGILGVLAATYGGEDVSQGDAALVGMTSLYAFALTGLVQSTFALANRGPTDVDLTPTLLAPALGMGLGGLLALTLDFSPQRIFKLTVLPLGVGGALLLLGTVLASGPAVPLSALGGIAATFVITLLATAEAPPGVLPPPRQRAESFQVLPVPVVVRAGRRNESLGAGPGLLLRF